MAARPKKNPPTPAVTMPHDEDGFLCVSGDRLWKWRALDAELRAALSELGIVKQNIAAAIAQNPRLVELFTQQTDLLHAVSVGRSELATVHAEIEWTFGVSLKDCSIDDKTGRLYNLTSEGSRGEPLPCRGTLDKPKTKTKTKTKTIKKRKTRGSRRI